MFQNYIITALRNIFKHKLESFLNISGLVIGISTALLISLFVRDEMNFDTQWSDGDRLYRAQTTWVMEGRANIELAQSAGPLKEALLNYFNAEIETAARLNYGNFTVKTETEQFKDTLSYGDPELIDIFNLDIIKGDAKASLKDMSSIILSEKMAKKYFGDQDPLGKTLTLQDMNKDYTVTAIMRDLPINTHLDIEGIIGIEENHPNNGGMFNNWGEANNHTYIKLREGVDAKSITPRLDDFINSIFPAEAGQKKASDTTKTILQSVLGIHLDGKGAGTIKPGGDRDIINAFGVIAFLIIMVAAINFINLSTARASRRAREVALRKVMGAKRRQLIAQHMGEAFTLTIISTLFAVLVAFTVLPSINEILGKEMVLSISDPVTSLLITFTVLLLGGFSGIYPSLILSSFKPAENLKANKSSETKGTTTARSILVVIQSAVTIALIVATLVVFAQLTYFRAVDRGFEPQNLIAINGLGEPTTKDKALAFKDEVLKLPNVESATLVLEAPTYFYEQNSRAWVPEKMGDRSIVIGRSSVDYDFFNTFKIPMIAGRGYDKSRALDFLPSLENPKDDETYRANIVINNAAVIPLNLGSPDEAIGQLVRFINFTSKGAVSIDATVIGVAGDAQIHSIKSKPRPEIYLNQRRHYALITRASGNPVTALSEIEMVWKKIFPAELFRTFFVEDALAEEYQVEHGQMNLFLAFSILTIVIGSLGLYGLASFVAERRTKEIGIRKVLGAGVRDIIQLLLWQFSKPVLLANIIAWPIAGYFMLDWLSQYPNRLGDIWIGLFCVGAGLIALMIAWATVGTQAFKVARTNPIYALRYE